jgi:hypothetical protein
MPPCPNCCPTCQILETITDSCSGAPVVGALVTIKQGSTTIGTGTTSVTGQCTISVPASGSYTETISATNYSTSTFASFAVTCPGTTNRAHTLNSTMICVIVAGCTSNPNLGVPGATVTFTQGGTTYTATTGIDGKACTPPGIVTGTWTIAVNPNDPAYATPANQNVSVLGCTTASFLLSMASSYCCVSCGGGVLGVVQHLPTVTFSSTTIGSATLTSTGNCDFTGSLTYNFPAQGLCPAQTVTVNITVHVPTGSAPPFLTSANVTISYTMGNPPAHPAGPACPGFTGAGTQSDTFGGFSSCSASPLSFSGTGSWTNSSNGGPSALIPGTDTVTISA